MSVNSQALQLKKREYRRRYYLKHKARILTDTRKYSLLHREQVRATSERYRRKNADICRARSRECAKAKYWSNPEESRSKNRKKNKQRTEYYKAYAKKNKDKIRDRLKNWRQTPKAKSLNLHTQAARRARIKKATIGSLDEIKKYYLDVRDRLVVNCFYCSASIMGKDAHIDHIVPITRGGAHTTDNFCIACAHCNLSKNDKTPDEWALWKLEEKPCA